MREVFAAIAKATEILTSSKPASAERRTALQERVWNLQEQLYEDHQLPQQAGALRRLHEDTNVSETAGVLLESLREELDAEDEVSV